jgi:outer membrane receptor protein involved in Fe transport
MKNIITFLIFISSAQICQSQVVKGYIMNEYGQPISGANIAVAGTSKGTTSSADGLYKLHLKAGTYSITASYVGFLTQTSEVTVSDNQIISIDYVLVQDMVNMPEIVISASADDKPDLIQIPGRIATLEIQDIICTPALSTTHLLSGISGIHVFAESGIFSSSSISLRGIGGSSQSGTLVVLDGVPLNKTDGGSVNWNILDKENIETIEIVKGPGSVLFGSNAMGGIINIISRKPSQPLEGNISVSYGTYNTAEGKLFLGGRKDLLYWRTFISRRTSDGYINTPDEVIEENDTIVVPVFLKELFAGGIIGYQVSELSHLELSFNYFNDIRGRGTKVFEEFGSNTERNTFQAYLKYSGNIQSWKVYANCYMLRENYFRLNEYYSDGEYKLYEVHSDRDDIGYRLYAQRISGNNEYIIGSDARSGSVDADDIYYTSTDLISNQGKLDMLALFAQYRKKFGKDKWDLLGGIRYDAAFFHDAAFTIENASYSIEYFTDYQFQNIENKTWNSFSPKLSLHYQHYKKAEFYISFAKGFRAPVLDDLCRSERSSRGLRIANPELDPEYILNAEAGFDLTFLSSLKIQSSFYKITGFDFMHELSNGDSVNLGYTLAPIFEISNISRVNIFGIESDLSWNPLSWMRLKASYTLTHATIDSFIPRTGADTDLTGKFLTNIPLHRGSAMLSITSKPVNFSISAHYTGERWIRDDNGFDNIYLMSYTYEPYVIVSSKIWKTLGNFEISVDIDNLLNKIYINNKGYKSPGRMIVGKITYNIKKKYNEEK